MHNLLDMCIVNGYSLYNMLNKPLKQVLPVPENPILLLIYQRLCSTELKIDDLLLYLKGIPAHNQIQLRDAVLAHLSGDRTLIEEYVKQNKGH